MRAIAFSFPQFLMGPLFLPFTLSFRRFAARRLSVLFDVIEPIVHGRSRYQQFPANLYPSIDLSSIILMMRGMLTGRASRPFWLYAEPIEISLVL